MSSSYEAAAVFVLWSNWTLPLLLHIKRQSSSLAGEVVVSSIPTSIFDSGNTMDENLATQLGISQVPLLQAISASARNGHSLRKVKHQTSPVCMRESVTTQFLLLPSLRLPLVLGYPGSRDTMPILTDVQVSFLNGGFPVKQVCLARS